MISPSDLRSADALALRAAITESDAHDTLGLTSQLRRRFPDLDPALVSAVVTQTELAQRAHPRLGSWADDMVLESTALEQATRRDVARYRAAALVRRLGRADPRVADLGSGIGVDSRALAEAGCRVLTIDMDPWRCEAAAMNAALSGSVEARRADVRDIDLSTVDAAFVDPARRLAQAPRSADGARSAKQADPEEWSPPWSWVVQTAGHLPLAAKVAAGISLARIPTSAEVEWIDHDGETVEACVWFGSLATTRRRATVVPSGSPWETATICSENAPAAEVAQEPCRYLLEPAPSVRRAQLVDELAAQCNLLRLAPTSFWLTSDDVPSTALVRAWKVVRELPHQPKALRAALAGRGPVTWKTADVPLSAADQARRVGHRAARGGELANVVLIADGRAFEVVKAESAQDFARE